MHENTGLFGNGSKVSKAMSLWPQTTAFSQWVGTLGMPPCLSSMPVKYTEKSLAIDFKLTLLYKNAYAKLQTLYTGYER